MIAKKQLLYKRIFDITISFVGLLSLVIPIVILIVLSSFSTRSSGIFCQTRVGQNAKLFTIYKIKTMRNIRSNSNSQLVALDKLGIVLKGDKRVTSLGKFLRKHKLDELPQLFNVFIGNMSFVGPRPDIVGYADMLNGEEKIILVVKPGITGPATLAFRNEEQLLFKSENPIAYNNEVIWPQKIKLNKEYIENWSFKKDLYYIFQTIFN